MRIAKSVAELIGRTPMLELTHFEQTHCLNAHLLAKVESFNPGGSVKDRIALGMVEAAEKAGKLLPGGTIIEPTSGNTGIGLAMVAAARGYTAIIVMPDSMSVERRQLMLAYGAKLVLTPGKLGMKGAVDKANDSLPKPRTRLSSGVPSTRRTPPPTAPRLARKSGRTRTVRWMCSLRASARAAR